MSITPSQQRSSSPSVTISPSQGRTASVTSSQATSVSLTPSHVPSATSSPTFSSSGTSGMSPSNSPTASQAPSLYVSPQVSSSPASFQVAPTEVESCFDAVLDGDETDADCGGSCSPCVPGRSCRVAGDCDASLGTSAGTTLLPGARGVTCNVASSLCADVRASPDSWSSALPPPPMLSFSLRFINIPPVVFTAPVFRSMQRGIASALTQGTPSLEVSPDNVLVSAISASPVSIATTGLQRLLDANTSISISTDINVLLLLVAGSSPESATRCIVANTALINSAAMSAVPGTSLPPGATSIRALASPVPVVQLPPFPLSVTVSAATPALQENSIRGQGSRYLAPAAAGTIAAVSIVAALLVLMAIRRFYRNRSSSNKGPLTSVADTVVAPSNALGGATASALELVDRVYCNPIGRAGTSVVVDESQSEFSDHKLEIS